MGAHTVSGLLVFWMLMLHLETTREVVVSPVHNRLMVFWAGFLQCGMPSLEWVAPFVY